MNASELKLNIFRLVDGIEDGSRLEAVYQLMRRLLEEEEISEEAPAAVIASIDESIQQLDRGEGIPHQQVMKEMRNKYSA